MKNTKGFKVCRKVGQALAGVAFLVTIFLGCSNIDELPDKELYIAMSVYVLVMLVCVAGSCFLTDIRRVYRVVYPAAIVVGAWMHSALSKMARPYRKCYSIKERCGSYSDTYFFCQDAFDGKYGLSK